MANGKKSQAQDINIAQRQGQALELRASGASLRQIAERLGVSHEQIRLDIQAALSEAIKENVNNAETLRTMEVHRLDNMLLRIQPLINAGDLKAIDRGLRISEQRAKLLGLYAPQKIDHSGEVAIKGYTSVSPDQWPES